MNLEDFINRGRRAQEAVDAEIAAAELRIWGPPGRKEFIWTLPCVWCGFKHHRFRRENAHTDNEGRGRRGHYTTIVPLCSNKLWGPIPGKEFVVEPFMCHYKFDNYQPPFERGSPARDYILLHPPRIEDLWIAEAVRLAAYPW